MQGASVAAALNALEREDSSVSASAIPTPSKASRPSTLRIVPSRSGNVDIDEVEKKPQGNETSFKQKTDGEDTSNGEERERGNVYRKTRNGEEEYLAGRVVLENINEHLRQSRENRVNYCNLIVFVGYVLLYLFVLALQRDPNNSFLVEEALKGALFSESTNTIEFSSGEIVINMDSIGHIWRWFNATIVQSIFNDPVCGDGICDRPVEFEAWGDYGCKADCGEYPKAQLYKVNVEIKADIEPEDLPSAMWNLCSPTHDVCLFQGWRGFESENQTILESYDLPEGVWKVMLRANKGGVSGEIFNLVKNVTTVEVTLAPTVAETNQTNSSETIAPTTFSPTTSTSNVTSSDNSSSTVYETIITEERETIFKWSQCKPIGEISPNSNQELVQETCEEKTGVRPEICGPDEKCSNCQSEESCLSSECGWNDDYGNACYATVCGSHYFQCGFCEQQSTCSEQPGCNWDDSAKKCEAICSANSCDSLACNSESACLSSNFCTWDSFSGTCFLQPGFVPEELCTSLPKEMCTGPAGVCRLEDETCIVSPTCSATCEKCLDEQACGNSMYGDCGWSDDWGSCYDNRSPLPQRIATVRVNIAGEDGWPTLTQADLDQFEISFLSAFQTSTADTIELRTSFEQQVVGSLELYSDYEPDQQVIDGIWNTLYEHYCVGIADCSVELTEVQNRRLLNAYGSDQVPFVLQATIIRGFVNPQDLPAPELPLQKLNDRTPDWLNVSEEGPASVGYFVNVRVFPNEDALSTLQANQTTELLRQVQSTVNNATQLVGALQGFDSSDFAVDLCEGRTCSSRGICSVTEESLAICQCQQGYSGVQCEDIVSECAAENCAKCSQESDCATLSPACKWTGSICESTDTNTYPTPEPTFAQAPSFVQGPAPAPTIQQGPAPAPITQPGPAPAPTTQQGPVPAPTTQQSPVPAPTTQQSPVPAPTTQQSPAPSCSQENCEGCSSSTACLDANCDWTIDDVCVPPDPYTTPTTQQSPGPAPTTAQSPAPAPTTQQGPAPAPTTAQSPVPAPTTQQSPAPAPTTQQSPAPAPTTQQSPAPSCSQENCEGCNNSTACLDANCDWTIDDVCVPPDPYTVRRVLESQERRELQPPPGSCSPTSQCDACWESKEKCEDKFYCSYDEEYLECYDEVPTACLTASGGMCTYAKLMNPMCNQECNIRECFFDGGKCGDTSQLLNYQCSAGCFCDMLSNGVCDPECAFENCGQDLGDCCVPSWQGEVEYEFSLFSTFSPENITRLTPDPLLPRRRYVATANRLIGGILLLQKRHSRGACSTRFSHLTDECSLGYFSTEPFGADPVFLKSSSLFANLKPEDYYNGSDINSLGIPYGFKHPSFDSEVGFPVFWDVNLKQQDALRFLTYLTDGFFLDSESAEMTMFMVTYNAEFRLFANTELTFMFEKGGRVSMKYLVQTFRVENYFGEQGRKLQRLEYIFLAMTVLNFLFEFKDFVFQTYRTGSPFSHFKSFWNILDLVSISLFFYIAISWQVFNQGPGERFSPQERYNAYVNMYAEANFMKVNESGLQEMLTFFQSSKDISDRILNYMAWNGIGIVLVVLRVLKVLDFQKRMGLVTRTIQNASADLAHFGVLFALVFSLYATLAYLTFGSSIIGFSTLPKAFNTCFGMLLGNLDVAEELFQHPSSFAAITFYYTFLFVCFFVLMNILLAILVEAYVEVKTAAEHSQTLPEEVFGMLSSLIRTLPGFRLDRDVYISDEQISDLTDDFVLNNKILDEGDTLGRRTFRTEGFFITEQQLAEVLTVEMNKQKQREEGFLRELQEFIDKDPRFKDKRKKQGRKSQAIFSPQSQQENTAELAKMIAANIIHRYGKGRDLVESSNFRPKIVPEALDAAAVEAKNILNRINVAVTPKSKQSEAAKKYAASDKKQDATKQAEEDRLVLGDSMQDLLDNVQAPSKSKDTKKDKEE